MKFWGGVVVVAGAVFFGSPSSAEAQECAPACRLGFVCTAGQCVSACNPPCPGSLVCRNNDCVAAPPPAPAPTTAAPAPAPPPPPAQPYPQQQPYPYPPPYAQPYPPPPPPYGPPVEEPRKGVHLHDGFYFRLAVGPELYFGRATATSGGASSTASLSGFGVGGELMIGGTVGSGIVLGGGTQGGVFPSGMKGSQTVSYGGNTSAPADIKTTETGQLTLIGPFMDWYFDPTKGLHAQLLIGYGQVTFGSADAAKSTGIGVSAGIGYEWWVGEQWSLGILGRLQYLALTSSTDSSVTMTSVVPGALLSLTFH